MLFPQAPFYYQNIVAAHKLLELLDFGSLAKSIEIDNPSQAKHIDDIIVHYEDHTRYYQVKWSSDERKAYTLHNLISTSDDEARPLIQQLARGYSELPDRENAEIVLYSTRAISTRRQPAQGIDHSLGEFIDDIHSPLLDGPADTKLSDLPKYKEYAGIIQLLFEATELPDMETFCAFLKRLRFALNQDTIDVQREQLCIKLDLLGIERTLYDSLLNAVAEWSIPPRQMVSASDVLEKLGLADRFVDRVAHDFKVEEAHYVENTNLFEQLDLAISELNSGFLLVEGPPGSGKSTALAMYQRQSQNVRFAYYCFIPDEIAFGNPRLERETFLKSLCIGIQNSFPDLDFPQPYLRDYQRKLDKWLNVISRLGTKVAFIVDGLDHVDRKRKEQLVRDPLTDAIDGKLPDNVIFILSSQYPAALSSSIQDEIRRNPLRHIKVCRFSEAEIALFLRLRSLNVSDRVLTLVADKSEGLPLYLHYIASILAETHSSRHELVVKELPPLTDERIDSYHSYLYQHVSKNELLVYILAVLALRKEYTTTETLLEILARLGVLCSRHQVEEALQAVKHLLKLSEATSYTIYHDSFRELILDKTQHLAQDIHHSLVQYYEANPEADETYRHFYRHLFEIGQHELILSHCNEVWLQRSWQAFRPLTEIDGNLDIAWQAAIQVGSLKEFVRIAFLKQRLGLITLNLEDLNDFNFPEFLLSIGKAQEALRVLWDGARVQCSPVEFARFVLAYLERTGHRVPKRIAKAGLTEPHTKTGVRDLKTYYQACMLYTKNWHELFDTVSHYQWWEDDKKLDYTTRHLSLGRNLQINRSIQIAMVEGLYVASDYAALLEIARDDGTPQDIRNQAAVCCVHLLFNVGEFKEAIELMDLLDFGLLTRQQYNRLLACLAENRCLEDLGDRVTIDYLPPSLFSNLLDIQADFAIRVELLALYDNLRVHFLRNPNGFSNFMLKASTFDLPERGFFYALIELSQLWCNTVRDETSQTDRLQKLKQILNHLSIDHDVIRRTRHDTANDTYFIRREIHKVYAKAFAYAVQFLTPSQIIEFDDYWLQLDAGKNGYKSVHINLELAKTMRGKHSQKLEAIVKRLLDRAVDFARGDEDTEILVGNLLSCAEACGYCGFEDDAVALWNELFTVACGVGSHKDYQFNAILPILDLVHAVHPDRSLGRLAHLLTLAHLVPYGTDIEALVDFSAKISPELALELLSSEDKNLFREDALRRVVLSWTKQPEIDLRFTWAIVKTMGKWEDYHHYDRYTYPTMLHLFEKVLQRKDSALAQEIYTFARHQFLVEKQKPSYVFEFAERCRHFGLNLHTTESDLEFFKKHAKVKEEQDAPLNVPTKRKRTIERPDFDELYRLSELSFDDFLQKMQGFREQCIRLARRRALDQAYYELKRAFTSFRDQLPEDVKTQVDHAAWASVRQYVRFKRAVLRFPIGNRAGYQEQVISQLDCLVSEIDALIPRTDLKDFYQTSFDLDQWLEMFVSRSMSDYDFRHDFLDQHVISYIEKSSLENLPHWEEFCRQWLDHHGLTQALIALARRLRRVDPIHCGDLLVEAWMATHDLIYYDYNSAADLLRWLFEVDHAKAKQVLLESFYQKYRKYGHETIHKLGVLGELAGRFGDMEFTEYLYRQYELHNEHLAHGLEPKDVDYGWVAVHVPALSFEDSVLCYLVRLFDYPQVEIRKLALQALYDLILYDQLLLTKVLDSCDDFSENAIEHVLSLVFSVAIADAQLVVPHKAKLFAFLNRPHFNIKQASKEILLYCIERGLKLEPWEIDRVAIVNLTPRIHLPMLADGGLRKGRRFVPSKYQSQLLYRLYDYQGSDEITKRVYTRILRLGWDQESGMRSEQEVHWRHNINTNFDTVEINGPYFQVVQEALNTTLSQEIQEHVYEDGFIQDVKNEFRLYDPTDLLVRIQPRPGEEIGWVNPTMSEKSFLEFDDMPESFLRFLDRNEDWMVLYEDGHQRVKDEPSLHDHRVCYFRLVAFLALSDQYPTLESVKSALEHIPFIAADNYYRFELPYVFPDSYTFPIYGIRPMLGISENRFRGQRELSIAALLPDLIQEFDLSREAMASLNYQINGITAVEFIPWQDAFDQDRRRQKPTSAGVLLRMQRGCLKPYLENSGYEVYYVVHMRRSADKYKPEEDMNWSHFREVYKANTS